MMKLSGCVGNDARLIKIEAASVVKVMPVA